MAFTVQDDTGLVADANAYITSTEQIDRYDSTASNQVVKGICEEIDADSKYLLVAPRCKALIDSVGKDNVNDVFEKRAMITLFKSANIDLI